MIRGYRRLFIFEIILLIFLFLNSFVWNILENFINIIVLLFIIIIFKKLFGVEKDRHRYTKDIIYNILITLLISFLIYYLFGIVIGFYKIDNYFNYYGLKNFILPTIIIVILKEYLRYQMLNKAVLNNMLIVLTIVLFVMFDVSTSLYYKTFFSGYDYFIFISLNLLPKISSNIVCSYIAIKTGYKPNILWQLVVLLYTYIIPIIPNPNEYVFSIIKFVFPIIIFRVVNAFFEKVNDEEILRDYKKKNNYMLFAITTVIVIILVYFTSGYFKYYSIAIGSGSMSPVINYGDVVIVSKINGNYENINKGNVVAFYHDNVIVVHRVVDVINKNGKYYFYTKGDANKYIDNFAVYEEDIVGVISSIVPYIGLPSVWFNEL